MMWTLTVSGTPQEGLDLVLVVIRLVQMLPHANIVQLAPRSEVVNSDISLIPEEQFELSHVGLQHDLPQVLPHILSVE